MVVQEKEINLDLKNSTDEFMSSYKIFSEKKGIYWYQKWEQNNYRIGYTLFSDQKGSRYKL